MDRALTRLLSDSRAISPVIAEMLLVGLTVVLAVVTATYVVGMSEQVEHTAPTISFECVGETPVVRGGQTGYAGTVTDGHNNTYAALRPGYALSPGRVSWTSVDGTQTATIFDGC